VKFPAQTGTLFFLRLNGGFGYTTLLVYFLFSQGSF